MATDKSGTWSGGESVLWYTPTSNLDVSWLGGESYLFDEYSPPSGGFMAFWGRNSNVVIVNGVLQ